MDIFSRVPSTLPRSGSISLMLSTTSPNSSTRMARSSSYAGKISMVSPLTRKVPREKSWSLRSYWISTRSRSSLCRGYSSPVCSATFSS